MVIIFIFAFSCYFLVVIKFEYPLIPLGSCFILINYVLTQIVRALLFFGIRNDINVVRLCNYGNWMLKMIEIGFNFLDIIFAP